jgi:hypothetical protein
MKRFPAFLALTLSLGSMSTYADMTLREDTAAQVVLVGPFVDTSGAIVAGLTIDAADVRLSKNGANIVGKNSGGCTYDEVGMYACTFDATDSNTAGRLQLTIVESGALPVYHEFQVATQAVYDACCGSSGAPLTAASVWANGTRTLTAGTNIVLAKGVGITGFNDLDDEDIRVAVGLTSANLDGQLSTIDSVVDAVKLKTDQLTFGVTNQLDVNVESMNANALCGTGDSGNPWTGCP